MNKSGERKCFLLMILMPVFILISCPSPTDYEIPVRNVILIIGDGMGEEQVKAAGYYLSGAPGSLSFESFPYRTEMTTHSASSSVTDSAAAATAMATGRKVNNGVLSLELPGSGESLMTLLEIARDEGKSTGLVSTTSMTHATPAAFGAHAASRDFKDSIAEDYLGSSRPNVLFGGGGNGMTVREAEAAGYLVCETLEELSVLDSDAGAYFSGQFGVDHLPYQYDGAGNLPELSDMALRALDILEEDPDGFFLMIEAGRIDHAGHSNDLVRNIFEVLELSDTVEQVLDWADGQEDTLIIVTADHETGGLSVLGGNGAGVLPTVSWSTTGHTGVNVPVYLWGYGAEQLSLTVRDNTDIFSGIAEESRGL